MNFFLLIEGAYSGCVITENTPEKGAFKKT